MADQDRTENLGVISNVYSVADVAWAAIKDKLSGQPVGTTATTRYGAMSSAFGVAEQLEIWNSSDKKFDDFERFVVGLGTNVPGAVGYGLMPKKWFDDHFDQGQNEADTLRKLLDAEKRLSKLIKPFDEVVHRYHEASREESNLSDAQRHVVHARIKENAANIVGKNLLGVELDNHPHHYSDEQQITNELGR